MTKYKNDYFGEKEKISKENYCTWCWEQCPEEQKKKVPVYACIPFGQSGWTSPMNVCRNCLCSVINQEIENIRLEVADNYEGKEWRVPMEIEVIKSIAFEGLN